MECSVRVRVSPNPRCEEWNHVSTPILMAPKTYESMYDKCGRKSLVGLAIQKVNNDSQATVSIH